MATFSMLLPRTSSDVLAGGTVAWSNASNINAVDDAYATVTLTNGQISHYMQGLDCGFTIPSIATITGIEIILEAHTSIATPVAVSIRLVNNTLIGAAISTMTISSANLNDGGQLVGSPTNLWNATLTPAIVNSSTFGVTFLITNNTGSTLTASFDWTYIRIYYDTGGSGRNMGPSAWWSSKL